MDQFVYDSSYRLVSSYNGQADIAVQGNWVNEYGKDGYLLCAWNSDSSDVSSLPSYVSSVTPTGVTKTNYNVDSYTGLPVVMMDPRAPVCPDASTSPGTQKRGVGLWSNTGSSSSPGTFTTTIDVSAPTSFNLSLYSHALNQNLEADSIAGPYMPEEPYFSPLTYSEQFGCYLEYEVTDATGTQTFTVYNNASGMWTTFPVTTTEEVTSISVTVTAIFNPDSSGNGTVQAQISALAFDPYESRRTTRNYDSDGDLTSLVDSLGNTESMTYNTDGTRATYTDQRSNETHYYYTDSAKNLTQIVDASSATWNMTWDNNGNMLTSQNPNSHTTTTTFDGKNRPLTITDQLGNRTRLSWDGSGNLTEVVDPLGRVTQFSYTPTNRLKLIIDPMLGQTQMTYDPSGNLLTVEDQRSNTSTLTYDDAGRLIQVTQPDTQLVKLAMDAMDRVVAITTPNGNQTTLSDINLTNGANLVRNPGVENANPLDPAGLEAQFWLSSTGSNNRDSSQSHSGTYSLPTAVASGGTPPTWYQLDLPLPPGGSYLANVWAEANSTSTSFGVSLSAKVMSLTHAVETLAGPETSMAASMTWQQLAPFQFEVPGDSMYTRYSTSVFYATLTNTTGATVNAWLDDFTLTPLSTTYHYDYAGGVQEVRRPDGSRWRLYRDRFSRVVVAEDPKGQQTQIQYDTLDRVVLVIDPLSNQTGFGYDPASNLISVTDARSDETQFAYNSRNLLETITYPDTTTEQFTYDPAANLLTYEDNQSRTRTFYYDNVERLIEVVYSDSTHINFSWDGAGQLFSRLERNGDLTTYFYDALSRVTNEIRTLGGSSPNAAWSHAQTFDAASNRTSFEFDPAVYGTAIYGTDVYGGPASWQVLSGGYDSMNRMPGYLDQLSNEVSFSYDVEGRRTQIVFPFGSPLVTTTASYDIIGRLLSQNTATGSTNLLSLSYGYDQASNRVGMVAGSDTWDYDLDASNRLINASLNAFVEQLAAHFELGTCSGVEVDESTPGVRLLACSDTFSGTNLNADRWRVAYNNTTIGTVDFVGTEVRQNDGLLLAYPIGYTDAGVASTQQNWSDPYGIYGYMNFGIELRNLISGDFDIQLEFSDFQASLFPSPEPTPDHNLWTGLYIQDAPVGINPENYIDILRASDTYYGDNYLAQVVISGSFDQISTPTTDTSGSLRLQRTGSTVTISYGSGDSWTVLYTGSWTSENDLYCGILLATYQSIGSVRHCNFSVAEGSNYPTSGTYTSSVYDAGRAPTWGTLTWQATTPSGTAVEFQLASSSSPEGPWNFVGPTGSGSYYTTSGTAIPSTGSGAITGRYLRYQATLTGTGAATPEFTQVMATYSGTNTSTLYSYAMDGVGNITGTSTQTSAGTATTARTFNDLNQVTTNVVTPVSGGPTTYTYSFNLDGTLASKTDGTNTWAYTWDPDGDQRLLSFAYNGVTLVAFTYDEKGRMLTRTPYSGGEAGPATQFEWDDWTCVREFTPTGTFRYYAPQGELITFDFTTSGDEPTTTTYCCHADALGSIRAITGSAGTVLAHYEFDAWGNQLSSSSDLTPSFPYRYVGAYGVRWDATLGMYYCQQRWYDPSLQKWISRDPERSLNRYDYCDNDPLDYIDRTGLGPLGPKEGLYGPPALCVPPPPPPPRKRCDISEDQATQDLLDESLGTSFSNNPPLDPSWWERYYAKKWAKDRVDRTAGPPIMPAMLYRLPIPLPAKAGMAACFSVVPITSILFKKLKGLFRK